MSDVTRAVRFANLDEARSVLKAHCNYQGPDIFEDSGEEPQGLLSVVTADLVPEEIFFRLFDAGKGTVVNVEIIDYSGFGPPAEEADYMGFVSTQKAYVLEGRRLAIETPGCPYGARDIYEMEALVIAGEHPLDRGAIERWLRLESDWDFDQLYDLIAAHQLTAEKIDRFLHRGEKPN